MAVWGQYGDSMGVVWGGGWTTRRTSCKGVTGLRKITGRNSGVWLLVVHSRRRDCGVLSRLSRDQDHLTEDSPIGSLVISPQWIRWRMVNKCY